jgi:ABC-2 type transport system ATP-binding protein
VVRGLWKRFDAKVAVAGIDLDIPDGSFFGVLGPNGAGKTTTIRMCTGLLRPDAGQVWIDGVDVWSDPVAAKARIGVLPDEFRLFDRLSGRELLEYCGLLRGLPPATVTDRGHELLQLFDLEEAADTLVVDYSTGMRKKVALACALLHGPSVVFLDEPFEAIDPVAVRVIREVLERYCERGGTVVFSSHVMDTVEKVCDRVAIVHGGRIVAGGEIKELTKGRTLEDVFVEAVGGRDVDAGALEWLGASPPP